jgi:hypothetical protein
MEARNKIEDAKEVLRNAGYFVDNLWNVEDVKVRYKCDDDTAQDILNGALTNEWISEQIFSTIKDLAEDEGLEEIEY